MKKYIILFAIALFSIQSLFPQCNNGLNTVNIDATCSGYINSSSKSTVIIAHDLVEFQPGSEIVGASGKTFEAQTVNNINGINFLLPNSTGTVGLYEKLEIGVGVPSSIQTSINNFFGNNGYGNQSNSTYINPYDPDQISVEATFHYVDNANVPDQVVYGFYYRSFSYSKNTLVSDQSTWNSTWVEDQNLTYHWRVRFAPKYTGNWNVKLVIKLNGTTVYNDATGNNFTCVTSSNPGFIKIGASNRFFRFLNDSSYYAVGIDLPYPDPEHFDNDNTKFCPVENVEHKSFITKIANAGGNFSKVMMVPYGFEIEFNHLGNYDDRQNLAWELDNVLETARANNLYILLSIESGVSLFNYDSNGRTTGSNSSNYPYAWDYNPYKYNAGNGTGIQGVNTASDFLTSTNAINQYKKKLRYIISRWGYSTNIESFELFSEVHLLMEVYTGSSTKDPTWDTNISNWHATMAKYIKKDLNHNDHLISISENGNDFKMDTSYLIDFTQRHCYHNWHRKGNNETAADVICNLRYSKPVMVSEIGLGGDDCGMEANDQVYHNELWGSAFSGSASAGVEWWWLPYLRDGNYLNELSNFKNFVNNIDFDIEKYHPQSSLATLSTSDLNYPHYDASHPTLEAFTLTNINGALSSKAIGYVHNRSSYYYNFISCSNSAYNGAALSSIYTSCKGAGEAPNDDDDITCPLEGDLGSFSISNLKANINYDVIWYSTKNLSIAKTNPNTTADASGNLVLTPPTMDSNNQDYAYIASCKAFSGWMEKQTCPGQFNTVITNSELETDGSGIYYINTNNQVCVVYYAGNRWHDAIVSTNAPLASQNGGILYNSNDGGIYYVGTNGKIYKLRYTSGGWIYSQACSGQVNVAVSNSDLVTDGTSIFYINNNYEVCELYNNNGTWSDVSLNTATPNAPKSINNGRGLMYKPNDGLYYVGTDGYIWKFYYYLGAWQYQKVCTGQWHNVLAGSELKQDNGSAVYYINTNSYICALSHVPGNPWNDAVLNSSITVKPNSHLAYSNGMIYFTDVNNNLARLNGNNGWAYEQLNQVGYCQTLASSGIVIIGSNIYYTGSDNKIHDFTYNGPILKSAKMDSTSTFIQKINNEQDDLILYPNPVSSNGTLHLIVPPSKDQNDIQIFNSLGVMIKDIKTSSSNIDVNDLKRGLYLIRILNNCNSFKRTVVVTD